MRRYAPLWPVLSWGLFAIGAVYSVASILGWTGWIAFDGIVAGDAHDYWRGGAYADPDYRYSPAFYWLTAPLRALPFDVFLALWTAAHFIAIIWLGPWTILLAFDDVIRGNVNTFLAVGVVLAVRGHAWTWAAVLLTKVTPGVGILYHVGRREWKAVMIALSVTVLVVTLLSPFGLWAEWVYSLREGPGNYQTIGFLAPLPVRLGIGALLCLLSARWVWLLPVGMMVAMPGLWPASFALLAAVPRLMQRD